MNNEALMQRARLLLQQNRTEQAAEQLMQVLAHEPDLSEAHALLALCWLENKDKWHDATREAEYAIHLEPDSPLAHYVHACVLDKRSRTNEAIEAIVEAIRLDPSSSHYYAKHAALLAQKTKWQEALEAASIGLSLDPEDTSCASLRAFALERLGRTTDALAESAKAVSRAPDSGDAHSMRGWALLQNGKYQEAQIAFREALRLEPTHEFARLGMIQALNSNNFLFRMMFRFHSFASRMGSSSQWMLIIGLLVGMRALRAFAAANPQWQPYVTPISILYIAFCMLSWIADPLFNAFLRFHPFGKFLLSQKEKWASSIVAGLLIAAILTALTLGIQQDWVGAILMGLVFVFLSIPVTIAFNVDRGWPRWVAVPTACLMAFFALSTVATYFADGPFWVPFQAFGVGIFLTSLFGQMLLRVTVKH
jgi:tetratricopeptide (TPR) repeat protein